MNTKTMAEKILIRGLFFLLFLPIVVTPSTLFPWIYGKVLLFELLVGVLSIVMAVRMAKRKTIGFRVTWIDAFFLLFILSMWVSAFFGIEPIRSVWGDQARAGGVMAWTHLFLLFLLLRVMFHDKELWRRFFIGIAIVGAASAVIAWLGMYAGLFPSLINSGLHLSGLAGNPIFFAAYLIFPAYLALSLVRDTREPWQRFSLSGIAVFLFVSVVATQVRGAFIGFVAAWATMFLVFLFRTKSSVVRRRSFVVGGSILVLVGGLFILNYTTDSIRALSPQVSRLLYISPTADTATTRLMAWQIALRGAKDHPVLGFGPELYQQVFDWYYDPRFLRHSFSETVWDRPHNFFLEILVGQGSIGLLIYGALLFFMLRMWYRIIRDESHASDGRRFFSLSDIFFLGLCIDYAVQSFFSVEVFHSLFFLVVFLAYSAYRADMVQLFLVRNIWAMRIARVFALLLVFAVPLALIAVPGFYRSSSATGKSRDTAHGAQPVSLWQEEAKNALAISTPIRWEQAQYIIQDMSSLDGDGMLTAGAMNTLAPLIEDTFQQAIARNPQSYQYHFWLAELYGFMADHVDKTYIEKQHEYLLKAGELSPSQQRIPLLLAQNEMIQGRISDALARLEALVSEDPAIQEPRWFYGLALIEAGKQDEGLSQLERSKEFGFTFDKNVQYMVDLYAKRKEYDKIVPLYQLLIDRHPRDADLYARLSATYAALHDDDHMIGAMNQAVELNPSLGAEAMEFLKQHGVPIAQ